MNMCRLVALTAILAGTGPLFAQLVPDWATTYEHGTNFGPRGLAVNDAGRSFVVSQFEVANDDDIALTAFGPDGAFLWQSVYSGPVGQDIAVDAVLSSDQSAVYAIGRSSVPGFGNSDYAIIKYDAATGTELWQRFYDGPVSGIDDPRAAAATPDGGIAITGGVWNDGERQDYGTVKFDADGTMAWEATFGDNGPFLFNDDHGEVIAVTPKGDVVVAGMARPATSGNDVVTFKYDGQTGAQLWTARYATSANERVDDIALTPDGDVIVYGTDPFGLDRQWLAVRYDGATGAEEWVRLYDPGWDETPGSVTVDAAGDVYLIGATDPDGDDGNFNENLVVVALDGATGAVRWNAEFGDEGINDADFGRVGYTDGQGHLYVGGSSRSDIITTQPLDADAILMKYDAATGALLDTGHVDSTESGGFTRTDTFYDLGVDAGGDLYLMGASAGDVFVTPRLLLARFSTGPTTVPGDVDGDGSVGFTDLTFLLQTWGPCPTPCAADFDRDQLVGFADLTFVLQNWS